MTGFLQDLLDDMREKRLLPVALALVIGLVAVPVLLMNSGGGASVSEAPAGVAVPTTGPKPSVVEAVGEGPGQGSDLGVFDPKDPFKSGVKVKKPSAADGVARLVRPQAASGGSSSGGAGATPNGNGGVKDFVPKNTVLPERQSTSPPATPPPARRQTRLFTYVVDVKFGQTGDERTRRGLKRMGILPNDRNPMVVFLGVSSDVKRAVFLVDTRASQSGEGACRPSVKACTFLYLRDVKDHDEQFLTDQQGREYHLTLLDIRRVEVKRRSAKASAKASRRRVRSTGGKLRVVQFPALAPDVQR